MNFLNTFQLFPILDSALSLIIGFICGTAIGAERQYRQRSAGVRTNALVAIGAAAFVDLGQRVAGDVEAVRVISYVVSGIGFLGAGVILHSERHFRIRGLTSAACVWLTACIGIMCGAGHWRLLAVALAFTFAVLLFGGKVERFLHRALGGKGDPTSEPVGAPQLSDDGPHQPGK